MIARVLLVLPSAAVERVAQQPFQPRGFVGQVCPQRVTPRGEAVTGDQELLGMPVRGQPLALLID